MIDAGFREFIQELFAAMGAISVRPFFGGGGVYCDGVMFALVADESLYLKVDEALKADLADEGCGPFVWTPKSGKNAGEAVEMSYWRLPDAALDDPDEAAQWGRRALQVARKAPAKPARKRR